MKRFSILLSTTFFICCEPTSNNETPTFSNQPQKVETVIIPIEEPQQNHKFVFVMLISEEPHLDYTPSEYFGTDKVSDERAYIDWVEYVSCSDIVEYSDFTEDDGYVLMDKAKINALSKTTNFMFELNQVQNLDKRRELSENRIRIKSTKFLEFDSYKKATLSRDAILKNHNQ